MDLHCMEFKSVSGRYHDTANRIRAIRCLWRMNAREFAQFLGIPEKTYYQMENGKYHLHTENAKILRQMTGFTLDFLYLGDTSTLQTEKVIQISKIYPDAIDSRTDGKADIS